MKRYKIGEHTSRKLLVNCRADLFNYLNNMLVPASYEINLGKELTDNDCVATAIYFSRSDSAGLPSENEIVVLKTFVSAYILAYGAGHRNAVKACVVGMKDMLADVMGKAVEAGGKFISEFPE